MILNQTIKYFAIAFFAMLFCQNILAQENKEFNIFELMQRKDISLSEKRSIADKHFEKVGTGRGTGYKHFQRWYYEKRFHVDERGFEIPLEKEFMAYKAAERYLRPQNQDRAVANWTELGPQTWSATTGWNPGIGRITSIAVQTTNTNVIYVSSPGGGIWKTTNGGTTWSCLSDNFNAEWMYIYNLCIDPSNANTIYAGVMGIGGGVIKSTNGGTTWFATGSGGDDIRKIIVHPSNSNIVLAAASDGIWRSTNGGSTWTQTANTFSMDLPEDIEFKPGTPNIVYASGNASIIKRSTDNGVTWTDISLGSNGRTMLAVTPHKNSIVYAVQDNNNRFGKFYKSSNSGVSFTTLITGNPANGTNFFGYSTSGSDNKGQARHDMAICVNPTDSNEVHIGGVLLWKSTNGGNSFVAETDWQLPNTLGYTHPDMHALEYIGSTIYSGSDGGIYKSTNKGSSWIDFSTGLGIRQFYNIACAKTDGNIIYGAAQDNGVSIHQANGTWIDWLGADGVGSCISPTNDNVGFGLSQNGEYLYKTSDGGQTRMTLDKTHSGEWVVPLVAHPYSPDTLYVGWDGLYRVNANTGAVIDSFFTNIPYVGIDDGMDIIAIAPSNTRYIYVFNKETLILYRTSDDGLNWTTLNTGLDITSICVSPSNPLKIWITTAATSNNVRVSTNGGNSWSIIATGLPSIAARSIVVDHTPNEGLYLGMNIGVYYRDNANPNWVLHANGLPNVAINEVELQNSTRKVRIATFGRGAWETDMQPGVFAGEDIRLDCNTPSAILKAVGGVSYVWSNGATFSTTIVAPTITTTYSVTATLANGSTAVDNVKVTVDKTAPSFTLGNDISLNCALQSAILTPTNANLDFVWNTGATTTTLFVAPTITTTYSVTATGSNGCKASDAIVVNVNRTAPTLNPLSNATITCSVNAITLNAITNANTFLWSNGATTSSITVSPTAKTTYRVTVTGTNGCTNTDASTISIDKSPPIADAGNDITLTCTNPSATLSAWGTLTSNYDYLWNTGATAQNITISPSTSRTYSLTVTAQNGCTATDAVFVTVNKTAPTLNAGTDKTVNCISPNTTLTATSSGTFLWNTGATTSSITVSPTLTTTYTITATGSNGCTASDEVVVTADKIAPTANAGADVTVNCISPSVYITASGGGSYLWTTAETVNSIKVTPASTTTYVVTVTSLNGCTASDAVLVTADKTAPTANAGSDKTINCTILNATLTATGNGTFKWSTNATTASIIVSPTITTTYTVTVTGTNGCTANDAAVVTVNKTPPSANAGADITLFCGSSMAFLTATGGVSYLWNTSNTSTSISVNPTVTTTYTVTVTGTNGCKASDDVIVSVQSCYPKFNAKVFLNNVNTNTQLMDNYITSLANFPISDPYSAAPLSLNFYHVTPGSPAVVNPSLLTTTGANAIVDWIFLELRTLPAGGSTTVPISTKSVLVKANGSLINPDGTTPIGFNNVSTGSYYITVRHRNHIGFRTQNPIILGSISPMLDFTNNSIPLYGTTPLLALSTSISAMNGGDANADGSIDAFDTINWESQNGLFDDYHNHADYNLDGSVDAFDSIIWELNNGKFQELD